MDIRAGGGWPAGALSNFAPHPFVLDGVRCASMEGFLQSLKFSNPDMQEAVCGLAGAAAKKKGAKKDWRRDGRLHWRGRVLDRFGLEYQELLDRAYTALSVQSGSFRRALAACRGRSFEHSLGKRKESETVLTAREFTSRLAAARDRVLAEDEKSRRNAP